jgi:hypothetical protein
MVMIVTPNSSASSSIRAEPLSMIRFRLSSPRRSVELGALRASRELREPQRIPAGTHYGTAYP